MIFKNIFEKILSEFPNLRNEHEKHIKWWNGQEPEIHNTFGDIFTPFIIDSIKKNDEDALIKTSEILEEMAINKQTEVKKVLVCSILEIIGDDTKNLDVFSPFLKPETRKLFLENELKWGRFENCRKIDKS